MLTKMRRGYLKYEEFLDELPQSLFEKLTEMEPN